MKEILVIDIDVKYDKQTSEALLIFTSDINEFIVIKIDAHSYIIQNIIQVTQNNIDASPRKMQLNNTIFSLSQNILDELYSALIEFMAERDDLLDNFNDNLILN